MKKCAFTDEMCLLLKEKEMSLLVYIGFRKTKEAPTNEPIWSGLLLVGCCLI